MDFLISSLSQYKYLILFPLSIVEGPIVTVVAGFLCSEGVMDLQFVFPILIVGDSMGDSFYYCLGRWSQSPAVKKIAVRFGVPSENLASMKIFFHDNPAKVILLSKIFLGVGVVGLVLAGNAKIPYGKFLRMCLVVTAAQSALYLTIGMLFGQAFIQINQYLNWFAAAGIIAFLALLVFFGIRALTRTI